MIEDFMPYVSILTMLAGIIYYVLALRIWNRMAISLEEIKKSLKD